MKTRRQARANRTWRTLQCAATLSVLGGAAGQAYAQEEGASPPQREPEQLEEIVVTGYRFSLNQALEEKRTAIGAVDSIVAEDIADFPDLNLAESVQRIPGVSIERDAGEGRRISVRGLGPQFTRVRINGMEALATTGSADSSGGTNRDRSFDFNVFASELFNEITVRKTASAEVEEGSLGATVDLRAARPFDYDGFTFVTSVQGGFNDLSEELDPRAALLVSNQWADGKFGALLSAAYSKRDLREEGSSTVRWQNSGACPPQPATPGGSCFTTLGPGYATSGSTATLDQINAAFRPRIPRYDRYDHEQDRLGVTGSLQFQPMAGTLFTLDALYSKLDAQREEVYLESPVFSTNGAQAINAVKPNAVVIDSSNTMVFGSFDDVDIRSEFRRDELVTELTQVTLDAEHQFTDAFRVHGLVGRAESQHENPIQTTLIIDADDIDGYTFDFRNSSRLPVITYGNLNVTDPAQWRLSQIRLRPQTADNTFDTALADIAYDLTDRFTVKAGAQWKKYEFETTERRRTAGNTSSQEPTIPASVAAIPLSSYSQLVSFGNGLGVPGGTPRTWLVPDLDAFGQLVNLNDPALFPLGIEPSLGNNNSIEEEDTGGFVQADFRIDVLGRPVRGNIGVRYVKTDQTSTGFTFTSGAPLLQTVERSYTDTLPSLNLVGEVTDNFLIRIGAAKVMARPNLGNLNPGASVSISGNNKTVSAGNPLLDPFRANAYDLGLEWYFARESLLGAAFFYKDVKSFVQTVRTQGSFSSNTLGLPDSVALAVCGTAIPDPETCLGNWQFNLPSNTPGGNLKGVEISYQQPFSFLPAPFNNFGTILNYTYVESKINYVNATGAIVAQEDLTGLSKNAANATLYFDNQRFSARVSAAYRDDYLTTVPGRNGNDVEGTISTLNLDFSSSWALNDNIEVTLEALNLTDEFSDQYVDATGNRLSVYHHTGRQYFLGARFRY